jgi:zinc protease
MKTLITFFSFCLWLSLVPAAFPQDDINAPAPIDPEIRTGRLDNGLTYFIRHNKEPEKRASFYIIQNVGAILENSDQNGLAHFLEHMAFNGTEHFPGKGIINSLEKHGIAFGSNINAYTGFDETVYNLSDVPVEIPGLVDTCLLILSDWSDSILLTDKEIDLERGVIAEEWRTSKTASRRMLFDIIPVVLKGSKYAERDIIGDVDVIRNFSYNTLRSFYHEWYRTDLQAIAVVGDINVDDVESKIKTLFSKLPAKENTTPRTFEKIPFHQEPYFVVADDKEAPRTSVSVLILHEGVPRESKNLKYIRDSHIITLMNSMMNTRIGELLQKSDPPFVSGSVSFSEYIPRDYEALVITANARKNEEDKALESIYSEAERARKFGFTNAELERAKASLLSSYENYYKQKDKIDNETYIEGIQNYFLSGEPLTSIDFDFGFLKEVIGGITAGEITEKFRELMIDENRTIIIQGLEGDDIKHLSEQESLEIINSVKASQLSPYEEKELASSLVKEELTGSKIIRSVSLPQFGAIEWTLGNNVKVVYRKADYEKDNIALSAFSFGGISKLDDKQVLPSYLLPAILPMYGLGDYDNVTLQKMLAGKKASISVSLGETTETINGASTPKDLETMMQLLYLRLAHPRFDSLAHSAIIARYAALIGNMEKDPNKIKSDSISLITTGYNKRTPVLGKASIEKISIDDIREVYTDRFSNAGEFTFFVVGNISRDTLMPLVEKYIGSLPVTGRKETWINRHIEQPEGKITREISIPLTIPKSTVFLSFAKDLKYNPYYYLGLEVINGILDIVYTEKVREEKGGSYSIGVSLSAQKRPESEGEGVISFDCDPGRADELKMIVYNEIDSLMTRGPNQVNLEKAVKNILKTREESKQHNAYWMNVLTRYYSNGINGNDPKNYENVLKSFTVGDIRKIARKMFRKANVVDIVFKPL